MLQFTLGNRQQRFDPRKRLRIERTAVGGAMRFNRQIELGALPVVPKPLRGASDERRRIAAELLVGYSPEAVGADALFLRRRQINVESYLSNDAGDGVFAICYIWSGEAVRGFRGAVDHLAGLQQRLGVPRRLAFDADEDRLWQCLSDMMGRRVEAIALGD